ncbi:MAG: glycosyltransferase family 2 protein [Candidatus Eremiobacteraeota bacterium]|nr:glycosyltransferase family 2 protein [Candidatus Eremiobacteraeota bacterium]
MDLTSPASSASLSVFFPAYNEEEIIEKTLRDALRCVRPLTDDLEIIVVDDGSSDLTAERVAAVQAQEAAVRLVRHDRNLGYGAALRTGFSSATKELVFFSDADGQFDLSELSGFLPRLAAAPVVAGYRVKRSDPPHRLFIAKSYRLIIGTVFGVWMRDIDCAFKLFRRDVLHGLDLESNGAFISSELLIKLRRRNVNIVERGVRHYPRTTGYSKGANLSVILKTVADIIRLRLGLPLAPRSDGRVAAGRT